MKASRLEIIDYLSHRMSGLYPVQECRRIARMVAAALSGEDEVKFLTDQNGVTDIPDLEHTADELAAGRPVQYIVGEADFCGERFVVREGVLIPRPETEELVMWAASQAERFTEPKILDVCTGSGCIALMLGRIVGKAQVTAVDISDAALDVARENAERLGVDAEIVKDDALGGLRRLCGRRFDIIVSNPPYIPQSEMTAMRQNVVGYEPHIALFVDDDDPLVFYRAIAEAATSMLSDEGVLMFEVHERLAEDTAEMLRRAGYGATEVKNDFFGKPRMICSRRNR